MQLLILVYKLKIIVYYFYSLILFAELISAEYKANEFVN